MARKTVLVTGASRGIGKAIAVKFAKKGYNVAISCVHSKERLCRRKGNPELSGALSGLYGRYGRYEML